MAALASSSTSTGSTLHQRVAAFTTSHSDLTSQLAQFDSQARRLPQLERAVENLRVAVSSDESRIAKGRQKLRAEWREDHQGSPPKPPSSGSAGGLSGLLGKGSAEGRVKLHQEYAVYMEAVNSWNAEEIRLDDKRRQLVIAIQAAKECRDQVEPHMRAARKLDHLYSAVFEGAKLEAPELEFFEWEVKCARETHEELKAQIENEMTGLKLLNAAHATHALVVRQFATVERLAVELPQWGELGGGSKDERYVTIASALGFIDKLRSKLAEQVQLVSQHSFGAASSSSTSSTSDISTPRPIKIRIPPVDIFPMMSPSSGIIHPTTIDGQTVQPRRPLLMREKSEDEIAEMLAESMRSARSALQLIDIERESAQRRIDNYVAESSVCQEALLTEKPRRRAMYRALFDRIVAENGGAPPPRGSPPFLVHAEEDLGVAVLAGSEQPPAYASGSA